MKTGANIYDLKLHEGTKIYSNIKVIWVTRVPGGWLYSYSNSNPVFVPFIHELI